MMSLQTHPVLATVAALGAAVKDVADVDPVFMSTDDKAEALRGLTKVSSQLDELRLRVLAGASDVAEQTGARDAAAWLAHAAKLDGSDTRRDARLAKALDERCPV